MRVRIFSQGGPSGDSTHFDVAVDTAVDRLFIVDGATDRETSFLEPLQEIPSVISSRGVSYAWHPGSLYVFVHGRRYQVSIRNRNVNETLSLPIGTMHVEIRDLAGWLLFAISHRPQQRVTVRTQAPGSDEFVRDGETYSFTARRGPATVGPLPSKSAWDRLTGDEPEEP